MNQQQHKILYTQEQLPIFQNRMYDTEAEGRDCPRGDMHLVEDQRTGLVFNAAFRPELMVYDAHYQNEQGLSPLFRAHLELVSAIVQRSMGREAIVEVGCGKGLFLEILLGKGVDVTGFDPTYEGNSPACSTTLLRAGRGHPGKRSSAAPCARAHPGSFEFLLKFREANGRGGRSTSKCLVLTGFVIIARGSMFFMSTSTTSACADFQSHVWLGHRKRATVRERAVPLRRGRSGHPAQSATVDVRDPVYLPDDFTQSLSWSVWPTASRRPSGEGRPEA